MLTYITKKLSNLLKAINEYFSTALVEPYNDGEIWTSEDKQRLLVLYSEGLTDLEIGIQLGRSRNSVYQMRLKLQRKGLK